jgi:hypothetical protein
VIRDARKTAHEAINEAFGAARRNLRRARRKIPLSARPLTTQLPISAARAVGG